MGPTGLLKRRQKQLQESDEENADDEEEGEEETSDPTGMNENLRRYELDRLKYYYAVVSCDCVATAESIYASCDGAEFEDSSLKLDLRFIADDMVFEKSPRDIAKDLPTKYSAPSFMCSALQQSKPTLSWDTDDTARVATMRRDLSKAEVREMEYAAYIASESSEDSDAGMPTLLPFLLSLLRFFPSSLLPSFPPSLLPSFPPSLLPLLSFLSSPHLSRRGVARSLKWIQNRFNPRVPASLHCSR